MFQNIIEKLSEILSDINPVFFYILMFFFALLLFWRGCIETRKDRSSIFDMFFLTSIFSVISGRVAYVILNWSTFSSFTWYALPYEKYGTEIDWFRLLPWRFIRIWDGGLDILFMFLGFLFFASIWVLFVKKWKWNHIFATIFFSGEVMLALSFVISGIIGKNMSWVYQGLILSAFPIAILILVRLITASFEGKRESIYLSITSILFVVSCVAYIIFIYVLGGMSTYEKIGIYSIVAWTIFGIVMYFIDRGRIKVNIEKVSSVRTFSSVDINQPIKLPR